MRRSMDRCTILEMRGITKTFPGVQALDNVNLTVRQARSTRSCGENGAGKSTLMKVLSRRLSARQLRGRDPLRGPGAHFRDIPDSEKHGIIIIHQELALVPLLSIAENIFLGNEAAQAASSTGTSLHAHREAAAKVGLREAPTTLITDLGVGKQQLVEIAKALSKEVELLILDEPTASLRRTTARRCWTCCWSSRRRASPRS